MHIFLQCVATALAIFFMGLGALIEALGGLDGSGISRPGAWNLSCIGATLAIIAIIWSL